MRKYSVTIIKVISVAVLPVVLILFSLNIGETQVSNEPIITKEVLVVPTPTNEPVVTAIPRIGGDITIGSIDEPNTINPVFAKTNADMDAIDLIYDRLFTRNDNKEIVGELVEDFSVSADSKTYTISLYNNIKWHDGEVLDTNDVEFTLLTMAKTDNNAYRVRPIEGADEYISGEARNISGIEIVDEFTMIITTTEVFAPFLSSLDIPIIAEHIYADIDIRDWEKHDEEVTVVGNGPFKFLSWEKENELKVSVNMDYYINIPEIDEITVKFSDYDTLFNEYIANNIDIMPIKDELIKVFRKYNAGNIIVDDSNSIYYLGFNLRNEKFDDENIRRAISLGINRSLIVEEVFNDAAIGANSIFPSSVMDASDDLYEHEYDIEKAKQLIEKSDYIFDEEGFYTKDGSQLSFNIMMPNISEEYEMIGQMIKEDMLTIGINVEIQQLDFIKMNSKILPYDKYNRALELDENSFEAFFLELGITDDVNEYYKYFHSTKLPPKGYNISGYINEDIDKLLKEQQVETDLEKRNKIILKINNKIIDEQIWIPIVSPQKHYISKYLIEGFDVNTNGILSNAHLFSVVKE